jgi:hypothetical protein
MRDSNFKPIYCTACGKLIWEGICLTGFPTRLEPEPLTIIEEITQRINQNRSYEILKTHRSFEAALRSANRIKRSDPGKQRIILASHRCERTKVTFRTRGQEPTPDEVPDYWNSNQGKQAETEGIPF